MEGEKVGVYEIYQYYRKVLIKEGKRFRSKKLVFKDQQKYLISRQLFSNILKDFNLELARMIIEENVEFRMPASMGTIRMRKRKKKIRFNEDGTMQESSLNVDWNASKKLWAKEYPGKTDQELKMIKGKRRVYHLNEHTEGYLCRLYWNKRMCAIRNKKYYSAILTRTNKRYVAKLLKTDPSINYYE